MRAKYPAPQCQDLLRSKARALPPLGAGLCNLCLTAQTSRDPSAQALSRRFPWQAFPSVALLSTQVSQDLLRSQLYPGRPAILWLCTRENVCRKGAPISGQRANFRELPGHGRGFSETREGADRRGAGPQSGGRGRRRRHQGGFGEDPETEGEKVGGCGVREPRGKGLPEGEGRV